MSSNELVIINHPLARFEITLAFTDNQYPKLKVYLTLKNGKELTEWCDMKKQEYTGEWFIRYFNNLDTAMLYVYLMSLKIGIWKNKQFDDFLTEYNDQKRRKK